MFLFSFFPINGEHALRLINLWYYYSVDLPSTDLVITEHVYNGIFGSRVVTADDAAAADRIFTVLMGDAVGPRKEFITSHATSLAFADLDV
jgi:hypothetical protein